MIHSDLIYSNEIKIVQNCISLLLNSLSSSINEIPAIFKELIWILKTEIEPIFPQHTIRAIASIIPLYIVPYIFSSFPDNNVNSTFSTLPKILTIIIQHLSNKSKCRIESNQSIKLNSIIDQHQDQFDNYLKTLVEQSSPRNNGEKPIYSISDILSNEFNVIYKYLSFEKLEGYIEIIRNKNKL